jgi:hypothetical protein
MELLKSTHEFFHGVLQEALSAHRLTLHDQTEFYLVHLLAEGGEGRNLDEPLALKLAQAEGAEPHTRVQLLREIGDTALYVCGFFAESLARRMVSVEYCMSIGGTAYYSLAHGCRAVSARLRDVFDELSEKFPHLVELLRDARSEMSLQGSTNVLRLYEQWMQTRSEHLARRLRGAGLILPRTAEEN